MRTLLESQTPHAEEAIDLFCYRAAREIGSLAVALEGLDAVVFTAGIGEHAAPVRERICDHLTWMGLKLDPNANAVHRQKIHAPQSSIAAFVIPTNEEITIARHTRVLIAS
jgi:acetate kinase